MALPCRPTWLQVIGRAQCTEVTLSCSCFNQRTRVLMRRLGLNVACASQVYVKSFKNVRFMHCFITWNFSRTLHLHLQALVSFLRKNKNFCSSIIKCMIFLHWLLFTSDLCIDNYLRLFKLPHFKFSSASSMFLCFLSFPTRVGFSGFL